MFQSTRPQGARLTGFFAKVATLLFQSTRPRGARLTSVVAVNYTFGVSIHAPAGGATLLFLLCSFFRYRFNPRARGGRDLGVSLHTLKRLNVSIHAPAGGATVNQMQGTVLDIVSIHAPAGGATSWTSASKKWIAFQSTRPRGARPPVPAPTPLRQRVSIHAPAGGATSNSCG